jgi:hypothetical protein
MAVTAYSKLLRLKHGRLAWCVLGAERTLLASIHVDNDVFQPIQSANLDVERLVGKLRRKGGIA